MSRQLARVVYAATVSAPVAAPGEPTFMLSDIAPPVNAAGWLGSFSSQASTRPCETVEPLVARNRSRQAVLGRRGAPAFGDTATRTRGAPLGASGPGAG